MGIGSNFAYPDRCRSPVVQRARQDAAKVGVGPITVEQAEAERTSAPKAAHTSARPGPTKPERVNRDGVPALW